MPGTCVTAASVTVGDSLNTGNTGDTSSLQLGSGTNTFNVGSLTIGDRKSVGELTIGAGGTLNLNGTGGAGTRADFFVGDNNVNTILVCGFDKGLGADSDFAIGRAT